MLKVHVVFSSMAWRLLCRKLGPTISNPALVTVVDGVIVALVWEYDGSKHFAFFFRLDAHAEATRIHQLRQATQWTKENVSSADIVFFGGDRNFVRSEVE